MDVKLPSKHHERLICSTFQGPDITWRGAEWGTCEPGDGIKMSSLLEKEENCPFSPSPSGPKNRGLKKSPEPAEAAAVEKKRRAQTHLNVVTIPRGLRTAMNIKRLTSTRGLEKRRRKKKEE